MISQSSNFNIQPPISNYNSSINSTTSVNPQVSSNRARSFAKTASSLPKPVVTEEANANQIPKNSSSVLTKLKEYLGIKSKGELKEKTDKKWSNLLNRKSELINEKTTLLAEKEVHKNHPRKLNEINQQIHVLEGRINILENTKREDIESMVNIVHTLTNVRTFAMIGIGLLIGSPAIIAVAPFALALAGLGAGVMAGYAGIKVAAKLTGYLTQRVIEKNKDASLENLGNVFAENFKDAYYYVASPHRRHLQWSNEDLKHTKMSDFKG